MKESVTKFDIEAAFKALESIEVPQVSGGIKANRAPLAEIFTRKSKLEQLVEEYYDVNNTTELDDAQKAREAEVAAAKLARIEKIVDLDAKSPEDLLTSYVGKFIIQCPQCMTLFYKNKEDIEESEDDPTTVNVNEVCQHCGNESGYTLVGKVGAADATADDDDKVSFTDDETDDTIPNEEDENTEETETGENDDDLDLDVDLEDIDLEIEDDEAESAEESFNAALGNNILNETVDTDSWRDLVDAQLDNYLTEAVNSSQAETTDLDVSAEDFEKLISSSEFKKPISDSAARAMMAEYTEALNTEAEQEDENLEEGIFDNIKNAVGKVAAKLPVTRVQKADWVLANALKNYNGVDLKLL